MRDGAGCKYEPDNRFRVTLDSAVVYGGGRRVGRQVRRGVPDKAVDPDWPRLTRAAACQSSSVYSSWEQGSLRVGPPHVDVREEMCHFLLQTELFDHPTLADICSRAGYDLETLLN